MVKQIRYQKTKSHLTRQQSVLVYLSAALLSAWILLGCTTQKAKSPGEGKKAQLKEAKKQPTETKIETIMQLTDDGVSSQAVFSNSGNEVLFVSSGRDSHEQSQVYLFDYVNKKMSRITYSDGQVFRPFFSPLGDLIIYSSSTDEDKEHPDLQRLTGNKVSTSVLENELLLNKRFPGFEIYTRKPKGDDIQRLHRSAGFDLAEDIDPSGKKLLITSHRNNKTDISLTDLSGNTIRSFNSYPGTYAPSPRFLPTPKIADKKPSTETNEVVWVQLNTDQTKSIVASDKTQKLPRKIVTKNGHHTSINVSPDGTMMAFSSNLLNPQNFDIFIAKTDGSCLEQVTTDSAEDFFPSFSIDGKKLLITSKRSGHFEVYLIDLSPESNPTCIPQ